MSVYNYKQRIEYWLRRIDDEYSKSADLIHRFADALRLAGVGDAKIVNYVQFAYEILKVNDNDNDNNNNNKPIKDWSREDVDRVASKLLEKGWSYSTIAIALRALKRLVHYAKHNTIPDGKTVKYCYEVEHIHPDRYKRKADKEEKVKASDLITREEFDKLIECIPKVSRYPTRDKAMLYVMYEFAARPSELLNMRLRDVEVNDNYVRITTTGKTGVKTLTLVLSYKPLLEWLEMHPAKDDPNAYLWYSKSKGRVSYNRLRMFVKELAKVAGIKKKKDVWLYLFRHSALTEYEKTYGSAITEVYGNWVKGSPIRNRYIHLANSDQHNAVVKRYGLLDSKNSSSSNSNNNNTILEPIRCYRCNAINEPTAKVCYNCSLILDKRFALELSKKEEEARKEKDDKVKMLESEVKELRVVIEELARRLKGSNNKE
jgi:integrase/recombinase XerD